MSADGAGVPGGPQSVRLPNGARPVGAATGRDCAGARQASSAWVGAGGRKRGGLGGEAEAGEPAAGEVGIGDEGHDGAATSA